MIESDKNVIDLVIKGISKFRDDLKKDENGRYRSWQHCYLFFKNAREKRSTDYDYLGLHLSCYLASWGMYRGSSFLLQKDFKIHIPVIEILLKPEYDSLFAIKCSDLLDEKNLALLNKLSGALGDYYKEIRRSVKNKKIKKSTSSTLITKILMGTLGCVPAYDRYFIKGIKEQRVSSGTYNTDSLCSLARFYERYSQELEPERAELKFRGIEYPQMKLLDMGFWQIGFDAEAKKKRKASSSTKNRFKSKDTIILSGKKEDYARPFSISLDDG